jgi:hypothetical protein
VEYLLLIPTLHLLSQRDEPWNGMLESVMEGTEHGMKYLHGHLACCNG